MAEFHNVDGRTVEVLQLISPNPTHWAVFYDPTHGDQRNATPDGVIYSTTVIAFALVEGDAGHGPEQDVVALVVGETGETEIAQDRPDFAGLTAHVFETVDDKEDRKIWGARWRRRTRADELMGAMPAPTGNTFQNPFGDEP